MELADIPNFRDFDLPPKHGLKVGKGERVYDQGPLTVLEYDIQRSNPISSIEKHTRDYQQR